MVRVLGINGSPRKYGNTIKLLLVALKAAEKLGAETELVHLYDYDIKPCLGCLCDKQTACGYPCVIDDDMKILYDKILDSNAVIISTPIYWFAPSGVVKNFIDRLTALENMIYIDGKSWAEGKVAGVIACGNDSGCIQVVANLYATLVSMGFAIPPWALAYFNTRGDVLKDDSILLDAANVGRVIVLAAQALKRLERKWYDSDLLEFVREIRRSVEDYIRAEWEKEKSVRENIVRRAEKKIFSAVKRG
ncbi:MAG: flavodoxin family protein [Thermoprotei archaeon]|nr:MAG: flavodoxin family protein [Thermoprotei archaeon]